MIANQRRLLHGARGKDEILRQEGEDVQADHKDGADAGQSLEGSLVDTLLSEDLALVDVDWFDEDGGGGCCGLIEFCHIGMSRS
jgi:hypothetical protein